MTSSDFIAIYGAVLSTLLAVWTISRAIRQDRVRLKVTMQDRALLVGAPLGLGVPDPLFIRQVQVVNRSAFSVKVENAGMQFAEKADAEKVAPFNTNHLEFMATPRLTAFGYNLPFVVQPRESGRAAAIKGGVAQYFKVGGAGRQLKVRPFVRLADGSTFYGSWMKLNLHEDRDGSLEPLPKRFINPRHSLRRALNRNSRR